MKLFGNAYFRNSPYGNAQDIPCSLAVHDPLLLISKEAFSASTHHLQRQFHWVLEVWSWRSPRKKKCTHAHTMTETNLHQNINRFARREERCAWLVSKAIKMWLIGLCLQMKIISVVSSSTAFHVFSNVAKSQPLFSISNWTSLC